MKVNLLNAVHFLNAALHSSKGIFLRKQALYKMPPDVEIDVVEAADIAKPWKHTAKDDERNGESIKFLSAAVFCEEVTDHELLIICHPDIVMVVTAAVIAVTKLTLVHLQHL